MSVEVLPPQDAVLWWVQRPEAPLQIGGLAVFEGAPLRDEGGTLRIEELRSRVELGLEGAHRFRQRARPLPLGQGVAWVDDERFDLAHHVRAGEVPRPGGDAELRDEVGRILGEPLDPARPLWEIRVLDGLVGDRVAVVVKASHVLADGMALVDLAARLLDVEPEPGRSRPADDEGSAPAAPQWRPAPTPGPLPLLAIEVGARVAQVAGGLWEAGALLTDPRVLSGAAGTVLGAVARGLASVRSPASSSPLAGPVGRSRDLVWARLPFEEVRRVAHAQSVTINDVVLALAAGAIAGYVAAHPSDPPARAPRVLVPVSVHGAVAGDEVRNSFSVVLTELPPDLDAPLEVLRRIHADLATRKAAAPTSLGARVFGVAGLVPPWLLRLGGHLALDHQPVADLAVTNLPGPRTPMYLLGSRMLEVYPLVTGTGNLATIIGVLSYGDALGVCITVDADVVADPEVLLAGFSRSLDALLEASGGGGS